MLIRYITGGGRLPLGSNAFAKPGNRLQLDGEARFSNVPDACKRPPAAIPAIKRDVCYFGNELCLDSSRYTTDTVLRSPQYSNNLAKHKPYPSPVRHDLFALGGSSPVPPFGPQARCGQRQDPAGFTRTSNRTLLRRLGWSGGRIGAWRRLIGGRRLDDVTSR